MILDTLMNINTLFKFPALKASFVVLACDFYTLWTFNFDQLAKESIRQVLVPVLILITLVAFPALLPYPHISVLKFRSHT